MATTSETEIVAQVAARLHDLFPDLAPRRIEAEVAAVLSAFADSKVRTYLPILVERRALERLRGLSARDVAAPLQAPGRTDGQSPPVDASRATSRSG